MGGNCLKTVSTRRVLTSELMDIFSELLPKLREFYANICLPRLMPEKQDHGDIDILVETSGRRCDPLALFGASEAVSNGGVLSFDYRNVQVDLIHVSNLHWASLFYSFGDFVSILGYCIKSQGLKFTPQGFYVRTRATWREAFFKLSESPEEVLTFLGLPSEEYARGFASKEAVFDFLMRSRFVRPKHPTSEANPGNRSFRNHMAARPMFAAFVEKLKSMTEVRPPLDPEQTRVEAIAFFRKEKEWRGAEEEQKLMSERKDKLNGKLVMEVTGVKDNKMIAAILQTVRNNFTNFHELNEEEIERAITEAALTI